MFLGAITISYNLPGVKTGLKLEGKTIADIFLGKIKTWNDPEIDGAEPGTHPAEHGDHGDPPLGLLGHDAPASPASCPKSTPNGRARSAKARPCSGRRAQARRATPVSPVASSRRPARSATSSRRTRSLHNFTVASVKNKAGTFVEPTLASTSAAGEGVTVPANLGIKVINSPAPQRLPDHLADVHRRQQGPLQGKHSRRRSGRQGRRQVHRLRTRRRAVISTPRRRPMTPCCLTRFWRSPRKRSRA